MCYRATCSREFCFIFPKTLGLLAYLYTSVANVAFVFEPSVEIDAASITLKFSVRWG